MRNLDIVINEPGYDCVFDAVDMDVYRGAYSDTVSFEWFAPALDMGMTGLQREVGMRLVALNVRNVEDRECLIESASRLLARVHGCVDAGFIDASKPHERFRLDRIEGVAYNAIATVWRWEVYGEG